MKPAFLKDVHFYGQGSRKRTLQNDSNGSANKKTVSRQNDTPAEGCESSAVKNG